MPKTTEKSFEVPAYLKVSKVASYLVYFWTMFGVIILSIRVFLLAFSASASAGFVQFIYNTSADYMEPFRGIFPPKSVGTTGYLDVAALFAIITYLLLAWGLSTLIKYLQAKIDESEKKVERGASQ